MIFLRLCPALGTCLNPFKALGRCRCFAHRDPAYHQGPSGSSTTCQSQGGRKPQGDGQACGASMLEGKRKGLLQSRCQGPVLLCTAGQPLPWCGITAAQRASAFLPIRQNHASPIQGSTTLCPGGTRPEWGGEGFTGGCVLCQ